MSSNRLLFSYARRYPGWIVLSVVLSFSGALFNGVSTVLIVPVLMNFLGLELTPGNSPPILKTLLSPFDGVPEQYRLIVMTVSIVLLIVFKNLVSYFSTLVSGALKRALANDMKEEGLQLLLEVDLDFYAKMGVGDLIHRLNGEVGRAATAITTVVRTATTIITILVFVGCLIALSWQLTIATTLLLALVTLANRYFMLRAKLFGQRLSDLSRSYSIVLLDVMSGMRLVRATANEDQEYHRIEKLMRDREQAEFDSQANSAAIAPINEVTSILVLIFIVILGRLFLATEIQAVSKILLTYLLLLFRTLPLISQLNSARNQFANVSPSVEIVHDFMKRDNKPFMRNGTIPYTKLKNEIRFNNLAFAYPGSDGLVLKDISLRLPRGTTLALVGSSGAGKSTLADLLPRFYDPNGGSITIDGIDLRDFEMRSLRRAMGIVSQDTILFNSSIRENIAYGSPSVTDEQIMQAAKLANAYEFLIKLPEGLDTKIGDRGVLLSGGQRQRLAIARALLQNPEILILDEATSALDTVSERLVQEALDNLSRNRTTLVIAHRLSTVQNADQIAVLDQGRVIERGTHSELLRAGGQYARLCAMQFSDSARLSSGVDRKQVARTSYEIRTRLNAMMGSLRLMVDGMIDTPEEQSELTAEAYYSALSLLQSLESLEQPSNNTNSNGAGVSEVSRTVVG
ncbi:MAG TPA: ATP-binding cassette domain-containing protein [Crinalium sp.]